MVATSWSSCSTGTPTASKASTIQTRSRRVGRIRHQKTTKLGTHSKQKKRKSSTGPKFQQKYTRKNMSRSKLTTLKITKRALGQNSSSSSAKTFGCVKTTRALISTRKCILWFSLKSSCLLMRRSNTTGFSSTSTSQKRSAICKVGNLTIWRPVRSTTICICWTSSTTLNATKMKRFSHFSCTPAMVPSFRGVRLRSSMWKTAWLSFTNSWRWRSTCVLMQKKSLTCTSWFCLPAAERVSPQMSWKRRNQ